MPGTISATCWACSSPGSRRCWSTRAPSARYTYGLRGSSILAALFNAVFLLITVGAISWEAILRLGNPEPVAGVTVMIVAAIGIVINAITAALFASGRKSDLNIRGAFLHMAADALVSAGVVVAGLVILLTGWLWLDPVVSLAINAVIVWGTWGLLRDSVGMSMAAVPPHIDPAEVRGLIERPAGRREPARPPHLADEHHRDRADVPPRDAGRASRAMSSSTGWREELSVKFRINHATVQIEIDQHCACALAPDDVV